MKKMLIIAAMAAFVCTLSVSAQKPAKKAKVVNQTEQVQMQAIDPAAPVAAPQPAAKPGKTTGNAKTTVQTQPAAVQGVEAKPTTKPEISPKKAQKAKPIVKSELNTDKPAKEVK